MHANAERTAEAHRTDAGRPRRDARRAAGGRAAVNIASRRGRAADGALLSFTHSNGDMVVAVTVNGHPIDTIDQVTSTVDAGPYLQPGANTIEVKIDTNLGNRIGRATQTYGLTGVSFQPYTETAVP
jgi:hypothetical protein